MRQIKFRAWDGKNMSLNPNSAYMESFFLNDAIETAFIGTELMQFTGLHDKNGKEIYEGDIVKHNDQKRKNPYVVEMNWRMDGHSSLYGYSFPNCDKNEMEVIGNIYENPDLTK